MTTREAERPDGGETAAAAGRINYRRVVVRVCVCVCVPAGGAAVLDAAAGSSPSLRGRRARGALPTERSLRTSQLSACLPATDIDKPSELRARPCL